MRRRGFPPPVEPSEPLVDAPCAAARTAPQRSVAEIHARLRERGVEIAERSVTNLLDRYDELLAVSLTDSARRQGVLAGQGRVILALDGMQPDVGHEVLWVIRDCLSGEVLLARSLLSGTADDLASLLREAAEAVGVPVEGVVSDGQTSIRRAVERALPNGTSLPVPGCGATSSASFTSSMRPPCRYSRLTVLAGFHRPCSRLQDIRYAALQLDARFGEPDGV